MISLKEYIDDKYLIEADEEDKDKKDDSIRSDIPGLLVLSNNFTISSFIEFSSYFKTNKLHFSLFSIISLNLLNPEGYNIKA